MKCPRVIERVGWNKRKKEGRHQRKEKRKKGRNQRKEGRKEGRKESKKRRKEGIKGRKEEREEYQRITIVIIYILLSPHTLI